MNATAYLALSAIGAVLSIIGFFLPWVHSNIVKIVLPLFGRLVEFLPAPIRPLVISILPEIERLGEYSSISGYQALFSLDFIIGTNMQFIVVLPFILAVLALICLLVAMRATDLARIVGIILGVLGSLVVVIYMVAMPTLGQLGHGKNRLVGAAISLLGYGPTVGFWLSLLGVVLIAAGGIRPEK